MKTLKQELIENIQGFYFEVNEPAPTKEYLYTLNSDQLAEEQAKALLVYNNKLR